MVVEAHYPVADKLPVLADKLGCSRRVSTGVDEQQYARAGGRDPKFGLRGGLQIVAVGGAGGEFAHRGPEYDRQARTRKSGRATVVSIQGYTQLS